MEEGARLLSAEQLLNQQLCCRSKPPGAQVKNAPTKNHWVDV
jgi:hypothetical protein